MKQATKKFLYLGLVLITTACGNWNTPHSTSQSIVDGGFSDDSEFQDCPILPNINPYSDWMSGIPGEEQVGKFTACRGRSNRIRVEGQIFDGVTKVCVFPAMLVSGYLMPIPDGDSTALSMCRTHNEEDGTVFDFDEEEFDAVFMVEHQNRDQMNFCLVNNNPDLCPNEPITMKYWSYGNL